MSLEKPHSSLDWFCLRVAVVLTACWIPSSSAFGDVFVMNSSKIEIDCVNFCDTSEELFSSDCQRGCRFFETFNTASVFAKFDDAAALLSCRQSCSEAYGNEMEKKTACFEGCTDAQKEYNRMYTMSIDWLHDLQSNMTFFQTLLDVTGAIVNPKRFVEDIPSTRKVVKTKRPALVNLNAPLKFAPQNTNAKKNLPEQESDQFRKQQQSTNTVPEWIAQSAFILFTLGVVMLLGTFCYCCFFAHLLRRQKQETATDLPPSYEQLVRNSYVIVQPSLLNDYHLVKSDKPEESCTINLDSDTGANNISDVYRSDNDEVRLPLRYETETA
ncbi:uncharacterized protein LOC124344199 isoform X1 [Daphnia pulicaria]|uniref:uncharacterized protein LOC124344199 isoform X1 n=1 Tax=Daphnia pulicaria TaxID=35523 RepID=UPI001EEBC535|nr:uncharacterized protein LOC124344199 isoform X1 [Daphnia pulicaria]